MKYSKKVREEAALICAIAASTPGFGQSYGAVVRALFGKRARIHDRQSFNLAIAAWTETQYVRCHEDAEAEALIRTGYIP